MTGEKVNVQVAPLNSASNNDVNLAVEIAGMPHYISNGEFTAAFIQIKIWVEFYTPQYGSRFMSKLCF